MGNQMSSQVWKNKKKRKKSARENQKVQDTVANYCQEELEIEFLPLEIGEEALNLIGWDCRKKDKHDSYIPFPDITVDCLSQNLSPTLAHPTVLNYICARGNLVVKIEVSKPSPARKDQTSLGHHASGYAYIWDDEPIAYVCPLKNCSYGIEGEHKVYGGILVTTNKHVILDDSECENSVFHFFFDSEDAETVIGYGHSLRENNDNKDYVGVKVFFHDENEVHNIIQRSAEALLAWDEIPTPLQKEFENYTVVVSHPHGWPKKVSFGRLLAKEELIEENEVQTSKGGEREEHKDKEYLTTRLKKDENNDNEIFRYTGNRVSRYTSMTCKGSSGAPVLMGFYWNNPFVHSSYDIPTSQKTGFYVGMSYYY